MRPLRPHDGHIDEGLDMHAMVEEAFQEIDEAPVHPLHWKNKLRT